jgi:hypothetical protein
MCFFNSAQYAYFEQTEANFPFKIMISGKYSFQTLTQFSQGSNEVEAPTPNTDGCLSRDTCVSST